MELDASLCLPGFHTWPAGRPRESEAGQRGTTRLGPGRGPLELSDHGKICGISAGIGSASLAGGGGGGLEEGDGWVWRAVSCPDDSQHFKCPSAARRRRRALPQRRTPCSLPPLIVGKGRTWRIASSLSLALSPSRIEDAGITSRVLNYVRYRGGKETEIPPSPRSFKSDAPGRHRLP